MSTQPNPGSTSTVTSPAARRTDWFAIPAPLARLFRVFPLVTYPPNELPIRSPSDRSLPALHVFASDDDARHGRPSFNPSCLKWQTFLRLAGVKFLTVSSNNHASPTGALPFLIPPSAPSDADSQVPVPSNKLETYALDHGSHRVPDVPGLRVEAYQSLLDHRIRNAWLYALYLSPANAQLLARLYVNPTSANGIVRASTVFQLRRAAEAEILQSVGAPRADAAAVYKDAEQAFEALETALGSGPWFFGNSGPGLFDAAVFAYTHLLLDESLGWTDARLSGSLRRFPKLVEHRNQLLDRCWPENGGQKS